MGKWVVVCAVVALAAGWLLAEERKFKSAAATAAVRKYDAAIAKARGDYERAAKVARDVATRELGEAIKVATRAGDLNAANEIQAEIGALATAEPPAHVEVPTNLVGSWDVLYTNGYRRTYRMYADGTVEWVGEKGRDKVKAYRQDGDLLLEIERGKLERLTPAADGRLFVEHWNPGALFPDHPPAPIGIATRPKAK